MSRLNAYLGHIAFSAIEQHQEQNQKQENKFVGSIRLKTGCKLFCYSRKNESMTEVVIKNGKMVDIFGNTVENNKANHNPDNIYFQAINKKNAMKKFKKYMGGQYSIAERFDQTPKGDIPTYF